MCKQQLLYCGMTACGRSASNACVNAAEEEKKRKSLYSWLSIDRSGACDIAAAPERLVTH